MTAQPSFPLTETLAMLREGATRQRGAGGAAVNSIVGFEAQAETLRAGAEHIVEQASAHLPSAREGQDV